MRLLQEVKERHVIQLVGGYLAAGWIALEVIDQLVGNEVLPELFYPASLTLLVSGIPAAIIRAWYHGAKGDQKGTIREYAMLAAVAAIGLGATGFVIQRNLEPPDLSASGLDRLDPTEDPRRIAVTYFEPRGGEGETELLATGLTESLIDELARVPEIHVVSRNGVAPLRGRSSFPTDSVSEALGVGLLVRGTVMESDSLVRVRAEVVRASDDRSIGSETFERPRSELFELQDQIAQQVALYLRETIGPQVELAAGESRVENVDAWVKVQEAAEVTAEAERLLELEDVEAAYRQMERADSVLAEAEALAPEWSVPPARRGFVDYEMARWGGFDRSGISDQLDAAIGHANRALGLNPRDADALYLRGTSNYWGFLLNLTGYTDERLLEQAEADFNAATEADPNHATAYTSLSHLLMRQSEPARAKLAAQRSYEVDPWLTNVNSTLHRLFQASLDLQDEQEARRWCDAGFRRFPEDFRFHECKVWLYALPGDPAERAREMEDAWAQCEDVVELSPVAIKEFNGKTCEMVIAMGLVRAGLPDSARAVARRARAGPDVDPLRELAFLESVVSTWLGDYDAAVDRLATYLAANPGAEEMFDDSDSWWLRDLADHPEYRRLVESP